MRRRLALTALAAVLAVPALPAGASAPTAAAPAKASLGAVNVLSGATTGRLQVRLDQDATFLAGGPFESFLSYVSVSGKGSLVGYALAREDADGQIVADHVAGRFPEVDGIDKDFIGRSECLGQTCTIAAGDYWLYLLTDGNPVEVVIRLQGPTGTRSLSGFEPVPAQFVEQRQADFDQGTTPGVRARSLGATRTLDKPGLVLGYAHGDWTTAFPSPLADEATVVVDNGLCTYGDEPVEGYLPYCGVSGSLAARQLSSRQDRNGGFSQSGFFPRFTGTLGFGAYQAAAGQVDDFGLAGVWLQFTP